MTLFWLCTEFLIYKKQINGLQLSPFSMFKLFQTQMFQDRFLSQPLLTEHFDYGTFLIKGQSSNCNRRLEIFSKRNPNLELEVLIIEFWFFALKTKNFQINCFWTIFELKI